MRNFYMTANIDGRQTLLTGGPRAKDGEMSVEIRQRDEGRSVVALQIQCRADSNGNLITDVFDHHGILVSSFVTKR